MAGASLSDEQTIRALLTGMAEIKTENAHLREQISGVKEQARAQSTELRAELKAELTDLKTAQREIVAQLNRWKGAIPVLMGIGAALYWVGQEAIKKIVGGSP